MHEKIEVAALCVGNALGTCVGFVVPLWVAAFIHEGFFSPSQVGWLASAQLFVLAGAGIATSLRGGNFGVRKIGVALAALVTLAMLLAAMHNHACVIAGLFLFAAASGVLHALMIRAGALQPNAPRVLAVMTAAAMALASITTYLSRHAMRHIGVSGLFLMIAGLAAACGLFMLMAFSDRHFAASAPTRKAEHPHKVVFRHAPLLACLGGVLVNMARMTSESSYSVVIAAGLGFSSAAATAALAISDPLALLGPLGAHRLGGRFGALRPILLAVGVLAANQFLLVDAPSVQVFSAALIISGVAFYFYIPYLMSLVGQLDTSGRLVGALPGLITVGASLGPALGGIVMQSYSFRALAPVSVSLYGFAAMLFVAAGSPVNSAHLRG